MITPFENMGTIQLEAHRDQIEAEYFEKASDHRYTTEVVIALREELVVIDNELSKRGV